MSQRTAAFESLRAGRDVRATLRSGHRQVGRYAVLHTRRRGDDDPPRIAIVASRKVGKSVQRNRAKRLLREAARRLSWKSGQDLAIVARARCAATNMPEVRADLLDLARALDAVEETV